jgi:hypothetical protein
LGAARQRLRGSLRLSGDQHQRADEADQDQAD